MQVPCQQSLPTSAEQHPQASPQQQPGSTFGMFSPSFCIFLEMNPQNFFFKISQEKGGIQYFATLCIGGLSDTMLYRDNADLTQPPLATVAITGWSGSKYELVWQNGQREELKSPHLQSMQFAVGGESFEWTEGEECEASHLLGYNSTMMWKLTGKNCRNNETLALFTECAGYSYTEAGGKFTFMGYETPQQLGPYWADMAVVSLLKLWQLRAVRKVGEIGGELPGGLAVWLE